MPYARVNTATKESKTAPVSVTFGIEEKLDRETRRLPAVCVCAEPSAPV